MYQKNISVILITFNGSKYIKKQIDSILKQTTPPDEIIICDDNSTDDTVLILNNYINNGLVKLFVNGHQLGVVENFKKAAKLANQDNWLVFADQDDIWVPQKLNRLADEMEHIDDNVSPALVYSDLAVIDKNDAIVSDSFWDKQKIRPEKINLATLLYGNVVTGCTIIINYQMAQEFFLMDNGKYLHDEWLSLIAYSFGKVRFLRDKLILYRQHESNITFSEDYKTFKFGEQIKEDIDYLLGKKKFLPHQFDLAKAFLLNYRKKLNDEQINTIEKFIKQEHKNYLLQRIRRRITYSRQVEREK
jgi:glycosyltransferase involved in cell wall biosynthesis